MILLSNIMFYDTNMGGTVMSAFCILLTPDRYPVFAASINLTCMTQRELISPVINTVMENPYKQVECVENQRAVLACLASILLCTLLACLARCKATYPNCVILCITCYQMFL